MKAVILAGGRGTRLRSVVWDVPKPLAPINGKPFLDILLTRLQNQGIESVTISTGYMGELIENKYAMGFKGLPISFSSEQTPLLTGGAIKQALLNIQDEPVLVMNGDSFVDMNLESFINFHTKRRADLSICSVYVDDASRYGRLKVDLEHRLTDFEEKKPNSSGLINAGVYLFNSDLVKQIPLDVFSFEDWLKANLKRLNIRVFSESKSFIDIGIPEDYEKAQHFFF